MGHPCPHWHRIMITGAMTHLVPGSLRQDLITEMTARGHPPMDLGGYPAIKRVHDYGLDAGGAGFADEPCIGFRLFNLPLEFLCSHVALFVKRGRGYKERRFASGRPYYKHHGAHHALVFTPAQHRRYMAGMEDILPRAEEMAEKFFASKLDVGDIGTAIAAAGLSGIGRVT